MIGFADQRNDHSRPSLACKAIVIQACLSFARTPLKRRSPCQTTTVVQPTWWQSFVASLYGILGMMLRGLVKLIAFLLIIVIGWFISSLVAKAVAAVLRKL